jgi:hypothetical protein
VLLLLALAGAVLPVSASALEPKKPSQLVTLLPNGNCDGGEGFLYGFRAGPDGSFAPFTIPQGQVLVLTRWGFGFSGGTGTTSAFANLTIEGGIQVAFSYFAFDADGYGGGTVPLSTVVGAGASLCGSHSSGFNNVAPLGGFIEGYLTKAK